MKRMLEMLSLIVPKIKFKKDTVVLNCILDNIQFIENCRGTMSVFSSFLPPFLLLFCLLSVVWEFIACVFPLVGFRAFCCVWHRWTTSLVNEGVSDVTLNCREFYTGVVMSIIWSCSPAPAGALTVCLEPAQNGQSVRFENGSPIFFPWQRHFEDYKASILFVVSPRLVSKPTFVTRILQKRVCDVSRQFRRTWHCLPLPGDLDFEGQVVLSPVCSHFFYFHFCN